MYLNSTTSASAVNEGTKNTPHPSLHSTPSQGAFGNSYQNQNPIQDKALAPIDSTASESEIWQGLIAEWCDQRDEKRLRETLDGLRGDTTLGDRDRRRIWRSLSPEQRAMCQAIAGGAE